VSAEKHPELMIALVIAAVSVASAVLASAAWSIWKEAERAEGDARYRRRVLIRMALLYVACAVFGIAEVIAGRAPKESLIGLPIAALLAWLWLRAAIRLKVPPA
jgi:hypothetical protein